jgi:hypothetical protein
MIDRVISVMATCPEVVRLPTFYVFNDADEKNACVDQDHG